MECGNESYLHKSGESPSSQISVGETSETFVRYHTVTVE